MSAEPAARNPQAEPRDPLAGAVCTEARTADGHLKAWQPMPGSIWYVSHAADGIVQRYRDAPGLDAPTVLRTFLREREEQKRSKDE